MVYYTTDNNFGTAKWIVDATAGQGTHATIATALTSASSGETIFIRPGTYTENLTLKAGVNLAAYDCDALNGNVTIVGKCTFTAAGTVDISGVRLQTNSDFFLAVTGSAASIVNLKSCYLNASNNTGISFTTSSSSAQINVIDCQGDVGTTGISLFASSSAGTLAFTQSAITNSGAATTASTVSAGLMGGRFSRFAFPITTSSTGACSFNVSIIDTSAINTTALTHGGSGAGSRMGHSIALSGTASAISIGAGATLTLETTEIISSNTNAVTGAGSVTYGGVQLSSSKIINTTTQAVLNGTTFTPVLKFGGGTTGITYSLQYGKYLRVDNMVTFVIALTLTSKGSSTGSATITGLPFTSQNDSAAYSFPNTYLLITAATATYFFADLGAASSTLSLFFAVASTGGFTQLADTNFQNGTVVRITGSYFI